MWESVRPFIFCVYSKGCKIIWVINHFDSWRENSVFNKLRSLFCKKRSKNIQTSPSQAKRYVIFISNILGSSCSWFPGQRRPCGVLYKWPNRITDQSTTEHCCTWLCSVRKPRIYWKPFIMVRCFLCLVSEADKKNIKRGWRMRLSLSSHWGGFQKSNYAVNELHFGYYLSWYTFNTHILLATMCKP